MIEINKDDFGKKLKSLREEIGKTQGEIEKDLYLSQGMLSPYEKGNSLPSIENLFLIANYFNVSVYWLIDLSSIKEFINVELSNNEKRANRIIDLLIDVIKRRETMLNTVAGDTYVIYGDDPHEYPNPRKNSVLIEVDEKYKPLLFAFIREYEEMQRNIRGVADTDEEECSPQYIKKLEDIKRKYIDKIVSTLPSEK
ncbi:MAG: helix-turn-helix domain-containing protein [Oscillospiraceae bacterium]|jgi:transcriptional regulator with XRE-family HTH domain|nr:helix-turn-helix domain-containing protein [Oscillospiraceae bacterium]